MGEADDRRLLRAAAVALGDLLHELVFVGGSVTSLLITDLAAPSTRQTFDVDVVVKSRARSHYYEMQDRLKQLGFYQRSDEPVMCRWFRDDVVVDVMPDDPAILGFTNRWYDGAYRHAQTIDVEGIELRVVSAVWFPGNEGRSVPGARQR